MTVVVGAQPLGLAVMKSAPFAFLIFGIAAVITMAVLVSYYFRRNR